MKQSVTIALSILLLASQYAYAATYTVARAPQQSKEVTLRSWGPFVEYLNNNTEHEFKLLVFESREKFELGLANAKFDFAFGNPGYAVIARHMHGYTPLLRSSQKQLKGIIVARKDSLFNSVADMEGARIAFPDPTAFAASLYIRFNLTKQRKLNFKEVYVGSHDNVYRNVLVSSDLAGGGVRRTLEREPEGLKKQLKIIYETPGIAPHPLIAHKRVPKEVRQSVIHAVLELQNSDSGKALLHKAKLRKPVIVDYEKDYAPIESLALEMYEYLRN
jgi:phosphonate transport system substrate-binding protein